MIPTVPTRTPGNAARTLQRARIRSQVAEGLGRARRSSRPITTIRGRNITSSRCSRIRPGASTWATSATTRWATWWRAIGARAASTSCTRWAGTRSDCRPKTPRCRTTPHPAKWTYANIATMRAQLQSMGLSLDWSREIATCDPAYYKHQQKLFLDFLAAGPGHPQEVEGQLGSGRSHRARQRAGRSTGAAGGPARSSSSGN